MHAHSRLAHDRDGPNETSETETWLNFMNRPCTRRDAIRLMTDVLAAAHLLGQRKSTHQTQARGLLTAELQHAVDMRQIAGAVVLVSRSGHPLLLEATGYQDVE